MVLKTTKPYKLNPIFSKISIDPDSIQEILDALCHPTWMTDYDTALHEANQQHTLVLTAFTGYNWCSYCQALEQEVFNTCEFGMWTISKNLILLNIDVAAPPWSTPPPPEQIKLLQKYHMIWKSPKDPGDMGYPTVMALNADGTVHGKPIVGYKPGSGATQWINQFEQSATLNASVL